MIHTWIAAVVIVSSVTADGIFDFSDGKLGVNFLGYRAGVGAGSDGRLHAEAGTPWGQKAAAGLAGQTDDTGNAGRLYAGATAGGDVSAAAGLEGAVSGEGTFGTSYAGASAGGKKVEVIKEGIVTGGQSSSYKSHVVAPVTKHIQVVKKPVEVGVVHEVAVAQPHPQPPPVTTVVQKTIIPNYEKKIIKVPSYEEKVIRVPTMVEKEVWVPAPPTIIEKEVPIPQPAPPVTVGGGYTGGYGGSSGVGIAPEASYTTTVTKNVNPQVYEDIFNIPISTLGAVKSFLTGLSSGASAGGSVGVTKNIEISKSYH